MHETERESKNQVFGPTKVDPKLGAHAVEASKADFNLDIPTELCPLPSGGKVYPTSSPLHGVDAVEITPMTTREEDILTSPAFMKKGTTITELIRSCVVDKSIDPNELLVGDRNALMVAIRVTGYGAEYHAELECSECGVKAPQQFDLSALPIVSLDIEPVQPGVNLFEFRLPYANKVVRFRFLQGKDEQDILTTAERQKKAGIVSSSAVTTNLLHSIVSIDGVEDRAKIAAYVRKMLARDSHALRMYIRDHEPGIRMRQETTCPSCSHAEEVSMPLGISFLWPGAAG